jgi:hypothetical protein
VTSHVSPNAEDWGDPRDKAPLRHAVLMIVTNAFATDVAVKIDASQVTLVRGRGPSQIALRASDDMTQAILFRLEATEGDEAARSLEPWSLPSAILQLTSARLTGRAHLTRMKNPKALLKLHKQS